MSTTFIDTNVMVYAHDVDAGPKHTKAKLALEVCWQSESGILSTQVLQEFYVTVTRKLPKVLSKQQARDIIKNYQVWPTYRPRPEDIIAASELEERHMLSFWDALIVVAAQMSGATQLISEDLQNGQRFGSLVVSNPFQ